jgi:membrane protein
MNKLVNYLNSIKTKYIQIASNLYLFIKKQAAVTLMASKGFFAYKSTIRAASLTYFSLLSVVPVVALAFGIAKNFGLEKILYNELMHRFTGQEQIVNWIFGMAKTILFKAKGGVIAGVGLVVLFWSVMRVLVNIENAFNDIWQVKKGRSLSRKFADYFLIVFFAPLFVLLSSSFTVYITTQIESIVESIKFIGFFYPVIKFLITLIPYVLVWFGFTTIYMAVPNTKVRFAPAMTAAIVAGTIFQITQWGYVKFQLGVSNYNALYGSFAALPLFMIWVQTAWLIVLFGAEYCFISQNISKREYDKVVNQISPAYKKSLSLLVMNFIVKKFIKAEAAPDLDEMSEQLQMPSRIVREIVNNLVEAEVVSKVVKEVDIDFSYQPAIDVNLLTISELFVRLDNLGISNLSIANVNEMKKIEALVAQLIKSKEHSSANVLVKDI